MALSFISEVSPCRQTGRPARWQVFVQLPVRQQKITCTLEQAPTAKEAERILTERVNALYLFPPKLSRREKELLSAYRHKYGEGISKQSAHILYRDKAGPQLLAAARDFISKHSKKYPGFYRFAEASIRPAKRAPKPETVINTKTPKAVRERPDPVLVSQRVAANKRNQKNYADIKKLVDRIVGGLKDDEYEIVLGPLKSLELILIKMGRLSRS